MLVKFLSDLHGTIAESPFGKKAALRLFRRDQT